MNNNLKSKILNLPPELQLHILFQLPRDKLIQICLIDDEILSICWNSYFIKSMNFNKNQNVIFKLHLCNEMQTNKYIDYIKYFKKLDKMFNPIFRYNINQILDCYFYADVNKDSLIENILNITKSHFFSAMLSVDFPSLKINGTYFKFFINLTKISLIDEIYTPIQFPDKLEKIIINDYKYSLNNIPENIFIIQFDYCSKFNLPIKWPSDLRKIYFGNLVGFQQPLINLPKTLTEIIYSNNDWLINNTLSTLPLHVTNVTVSNEDMIKSIKIPKHITIKYPDKIKTVSIEKYQDEGIRQMEIQCIPLCDDSILNKLISDYENTLAYKFKFS